MSNAESSNIQLELSLLNNGLDFILKGIDELFDDDYVMREYSSAVDIGTSSYKYGVLNLFSGFLLLLKERLYRHMPELIFQGNLEDIRNKVSSGKTPNTVALKEALKKLKTGPGFVFSERDEKLIRDVQDMRNKFEHYTISVDKYELWSNLSKFLELIDKFLVEELDISIENSPEALELQEKIHQIDSVWERTQRERKSQFDLEIQGRIEEFNTSRDRVMQELKTESYSSNGADKFLGNCPDCYEQTMIVYYKDFIGICSNPECGSGNPLTECLRCEAEVLNGRKRLLKLAQQCIIAEL
ncbi:hypothetical protein [Microcoleus sp. OTE_8_concoct_300]|uniref:hypothetical protein n=1 Tax=Microcoleus sp. OTE_8_concoct_300 TaxID=2964710 RepID=UPI00403F5AF0